jgi:hypothetical protein
MLTMRSADSGAEPAPMISPTDDSAFLDKDGLRLLGLSRVPRCAACARLEALRAAHRTGRRPSGPWPAAPEGCREQICAPLLRRLSAGATAKGDLLTRGN